MSEMSPEFDIIIVGSGPAGVSAAFPLVQAGLKVLMVDGGRQANLTPPVQPFLTQRFTNPEQWKWMIGENFSAIQKAKEISPKFRVPLYDYVFEDFLKLNHIESKDFIAIGSLAQGGLSNAWGCGVARLSADELLAFPFSSDEIESSYKRVTCRIGVSGANNDDLVDYFGLDNWSHAPIQMDSLHQKLFKDYKSYYSQKNINFRLGRSRVAVLNQDQDTRKACDISGNCLWGCHRKALYSATNDLFSLLKYENFYYQQGFLVDKVESNQDVLFIEGMHDKNKSMITAKKIILAAGTLATTRLALQALKYEHSVLVQSCPTAAFLLWLPTELGIARTASFGLGQLSYVLKLTNDLTAFGSTFSTVGLPMSEFVSYLPLSKRFGIDILKSLLSSCVVGNVFLPGNLSNSRAQLKPNGTLYLNGAHHDSVLGFMAEIRKQLRKAYWNCGAWLLPMSFKIGKPGGDVHYASTLPMKLNPSIGETNRFGEILTLKGIHIVDGACLSALSEKSHTLTIMANADRIGCELAMQMKR